ncbi:uncharacterized protein LOC144076902 [Stigmatopora argus]
MAQKCEKWSVPEVECLLEMCTDEHVQNPFDKNHKNSEIFAQIQDYLAQRGYHRTTVQCRNKIKKLYKRYTRVCKTLRKPVRSGTRTPKAVRSDQEKYNFRYFDAVDAIIGGKKSIGQNMLQINEPEIAQTDGDVTFVVKDEDIPSSSSPIKSADHSQPQVTFPVISEVSSLANLSSNPNGNTSPIPDTSDQVTKAIANFLVMDIYPPELAAGKGFIKMIHSLFPTCKELPSPLFLENFLKEHHSRVKKSLADMLWASCNGKNKRRCDDTSLIANANGLGSGQPPRQKGEASYYPTLSVDAWVQDWEGNTEGYITLFAHFIDTDFNWHNVNLATQRLKDNVAPDNMLESLDIQVRLMAQEWGISHVNLVLLGGKESYRSPLKNKKSRGTIFPEIKTYKSPKESQNPECGLSSERPPFVPCFFSVMQGCIEEIMSHPVVSKTLSQFQSVLFTLLHPPDYTSYGYNRLQSVSKEVQTELNAWATRHLPAWYRLYPLLNTLLKHKSLIMGFIKEIKCENLSDEDTASASTSSSSDGNSSSRLYNLTLSPGEWKIMQELSLVLKLFDVACHTLAKEALPCLSLIKPILTGLLNCHLVCRPEDTMIPKELKQMVRLRLASYYSNPAVNRILCVACSLDPQFNGLRFMDKTEQNQTFDWLKEEAIKLAKAEGKTDNVNELRLRKRSLPSDLQEPKSYFLRTKKCKQSHSMDLKVVEDGPKNEVGVKDVKDLAEPDPQDEVSGMEFLLGNLFPTVQSKEDSLEESVNMELSLFRACAGATLGIEPLQWWKKNALQFPNLVRVARVYLAAPAALGDMVQDFMQDRAQLIKNRHSIPPKSLDTILFLHHNQMLTSDFSCN